MKKGYRDLSDEKIKQKTSKSFEAWKKVLDQVMDYDVIIEQDEDGIYVGRVLADKRSS